MHSEAMNTVKADALKRLENATDAVHAHMRSCRVCRWKALSLFVKCRTVAGLLYDHMAAKANAEAVELDSQALEVVVTEAPSVDWLENLYRL